MSNSLKRTEEEQKALDLWQTYPSYKRPIIPSEFVDAFLDRAKEQSITQIQIDGELNPFNGDFKCRVSLIRPEEWSGRPGKFYDYHVASFQLDHMVGCGGILLSHGSYVVLSQQGKGLGSLMQEMKLWIAGQLEVGQLLATVVAGNEAEEGLLEKHGWQKLGQPFRNVHTENTVQMWQRLLT